MTISGPDVSSYQAGLTIEQGTAFVIAKATQGTFYGDTQYAPFKAKAAAVGAAFSSYHYLEAGNGAGQAQYWRNFVGEGVPCMLDVEAGSGGVADVLAFANEAAALESPVWGVYLPHWYYQEIGSPDLTPLADAGLSLVSSNYTAYSDTGPGWAGYGGMTPVVWQYTDSQPYGGQSVDFNAYLGTIEEFQALIGGTVALSQADIDAVALAVWGYINTAAGDTVDMHQLLVNIAKSQPSDVGAAVWAFKNKTLDVFDMRQYLVNAANNVVPPAGDTGGPIA